MPGHHRASDVIDKQLAAQLQRGPMGAYRYEHVEKQLEQGNIWTINTESL